MNPERFSTTLGDLIVSKLADVHTSIPAKITSVNYGNGTASAQPLIKTPIGTSKNVPYPELKDIPLVLMSGNSGKAKITFPVKAGDSALVIFSERDPSNLFNGNSDIPVETVQRAYLGLYPIAVLPCLSLGSSSVEVDSENIVLKNESSVVTMKPDGNLLLENGSGSIILTSDGTINLNGLKISPEGKLTLADGSVVDKHTHGGVESGGSSTAPLGG